MEYRKPRWVSQYDPRNPQARGLILAYPFDEGGGTRLHDVSGSKLTGSTSEGTADAPWAFGRQGKALRRDSGTTQEIHILPGVDSTWLPDSRPGFSAVLLLSVSYGNSGNGYFGTSGADGFGVLAERCHFASDNTVMHFDYGGATAGTTRLSVDYTALDVNVKTSTEWVLWVLTTGPRGMEIWQNGKLQVSNSGNPTRSTSTNVWQLLRCGSWTNGTHDLALLEFYDRQLSEDEIRAKAIDPWDLYTLRMPTVVKAPAGGDSNIDATTASLTLAEQSATVALDANVAAATDALTLAPQAASVALDIDVPATTAALSLAEQAATVALDANVPATAAALTLATFDATVEGTSSFVSDPFENMQVLLSVGGIDLLASNRRLVHNDATYTVYDSYAINGDQVFLGGFRANKVTGDYHIEVQLHYGYRGNTTAAPTRVAVGFNFVWPTGSIVGIAIENAGAGTCQSGAGIPPTVLVWNSITELQVGDVYYGKDDAFLSHPEIKSMWMRDPTGTGVTTRFGLRFDPNIEDTSYSRMFGAVMYGGSWLELDGTRVRPDLQQWHTHDGGSWYVHGTKGAGGFWFVDPVTGKVVPQPSTDANFDRDADRAHADAGYGPFLKCYIAGDASISSDPVWHFAVKQIAARLLGKFQDPEASWPNPSYNSYWNDAERSQGRLVGIFTMAWKALVKLQQWRNEGDAEVTTLAADCQTRARAILRHVWNHSKPVALPGEDPPIPRDDGDWTGPFITFRNRSYGRIAHPEHGGNMRGYSNFMAGLLWHGLFLFWEYLKELGETASDDFTRARTLMDFVANGYPGFTDEIQFGGFQTIFKWENNHKFAPPSPLPPTSWASQGMCPVKVKPKPGAPCWPVPENWPSNWAWEYFSVYDNEHNEDLRYTSEPSTAGTGEAVAMFEFMEREAMLTDAAEKTKLGEIIAQYSGVNYRWHLGGFDVNTGTPPALTLETHAATVDLDPQGILANTASLSLTPLGASISLDKEVFAGVASLLFGDGVSQAYDTDITLVTDVPGSVVALTLTPQTATVAATSLVPRRRFLVDIDLEGNNIIQPDVAGARPAAGLKQNDADQAFLDFIGTSGAGSTSSISSETTATSTKFGAIRIEINGSVKWIRVYDAPD